MERALLLACWRKVSWRSLDSIFEGDTTATKSQRMSEVKVEAFCKPSRCAPCPRLALQVAQLDTCSMGRRECGQKVFETVRRFFQTFPGSAAFCAIPLLLTKSETLHENISSPFFSLFPVVSYIYHSLRWTAGCAGGAQQGFWVSCIRIPSPEELNMCRVASVYKLA